MNSRERVLAAINHQEPDRVPFDLGATAASGISIFTYYDFLASRGLSTDNVKAFDIYGLFAYVEKEGADALGVDTALVPMLTPRFGVPINSWRRRKFWDNREFWVPEKMVTKVDEDGAELLMHGDVPVGKMCPGGYHFSELANSTMGSFDNLPDDLPDPDTQIFPEEVPEEELRFREEAAKALYEGTDKAVVVDLTDNCRWNCSIPEWLYCMALDPDAASELHAKKCESLLKRIQQLAQATGKYSQIFAIYQDWGTQRGELISPAMFSEIVAPHYKKIFDWIHANTNWKIFFHTCGSIFNIIPHMIDMGVDILNPIQCNAANMEPEKLKAAYGDKLTFWGGGVDTQSVYCTGTPEEVREQARQRIAALGKGGGYIFAPTQDTQADVPVANVEAMLQAVRDFGVY